MDQFLANGLCKGATYALVAIGFSLIYTTAGVFHLAHGAVYVFAAYAFFWLLSGLHLPVVVADVAALVAAGCLGILIELLVYRPLVRKQASSAVLMISSLGANIILVNCIALVGGSEARILSSTTDAETYRIAGAILTRGQIAQLVFSCAAVLLYWIFLNVVPIGRACRAVADDPTLAAVLGVPVEGVRLAAFAIGSVLAGMGSLLVASDVGMDPYVGFPAMMVGAVACIVGGLHRFLAPVLGGLTLGLLQNLVVWKTSASWESAVTFIVLLIFMLFRPTGLLGVRQRVEER